MARDAAGRDLVDLVSSDDDDATRRPLKRKRPQLQPGRLGIDAAGRDLVDLSLWTESEQDPDALITADVDAETSRRLKRAAGFGNPGGSAASGQAAPSGTQPGRGPATGDSDSEGPCEVIGAVGEEPTRDMPHPRYTCAVHAFTDGTSIANRAHCPLCFCYVCDVKASECRFWGTGKRARERDHSNAYSLFKDDGYWDWLRRERQKSGMAPVEAEYKEKGPLPEMEVQQQQQQGEQEEQEEQRPRAGGGAQGGRGRERGAAARRSPDAPAAAAAAAAGGGDEGGGSLGGAAGARSPCVRPRRAAAARAQRRVAEAQRREAEAQAGNSTDGTGIENTSADSEEGDGAGRGASGTARSSGNGSEEGSEGDDSDGSGTRRRKRRRLSVHRQQQRPAPQARRGGDASQGGLSCGGAREPG